MTDADNINAITALRQLHERRQQREVIESKLATAKEALSFTPAYRYVEELKAQVAAIKQQETDLRYAITTDALLAYHSLETKYPFPGVSIKVGRIVKYDRIRAHQWCLTNMTLVLKLDEDAFEANMRMIAKKGAATSPLPDFVEVVDDPTVTITSDLGKVIQALDRFDTTREFPLGEFAPESREG